MAESAIDATTKAEFARETELLGLKLLPGQQETLLVGYAAVRAMVAIIGADYPIEAEPSNVFSPLASEAPGR